MCRGRALAVEIRSQDHHCDPRWRVLGRRRQLVDEALALLLGGAHGEDLFELVDHDHQPPVVGEFVQRGIEVTIDVTQPFKGVTRGGKGMLVATQNCMGPAFASWDESRGERGKQSCHHGRGLPAPRSADQ